MLLHTFTPSGRGGCVYDGSSCLLLCVLYQLERIGGGKRTVRAPVSPEVIYPTVRVFLQI